MRDWRLWGSLQIRRVTSCGEGIVACQPMDLLGDRSFTSSRCRRSRYFCRKKAADFGVNVYRKSTGDPGPGKSSAKASEANAYRNSGPACGRVRARFRIWAIAPNNHIGVQLSRLYS